MARTSSTAPERVSAATAERRGRCGTRQTQAEVGDPGDERLHPEPLGFTGRLLEHGERRGSVPQSGDDSRKLNHRLHPVPASPVGGAQRTHAVM